MNAGAWEAARLLATIIHQSDGALHEKVAPRLPTLPRAVTGAARGRAVAGFGQLAVGPNAGLGMDAPEHAFVRRRDCRVRLRKNELRFPSQCGAEVRMTGIEASGFRNRGLGNHAAPPVAAFRMARLTATLAS